MTLELLFTTPYCQASELILPKSNGAYAVGTTNLELTDSTRKMFRGSSNRRWMATIFYPAKRFLGSYPYMPGTLEEGNVCGVKVLANSKPEADPILNRKFPLIIAIPGRGGERQIGTILYENLASHGYLIIAMDQPYVSNFVKFTDGEKITLTIKDLWKLRHDRDYRYSYDDRVIQGAMRDIDYLLRHIDGLGKISNAIDRNKIILMGHSLGGNVAHIMGFSDQRIKVIIDIDSKITDRQINGHVGVPPNPQAKPVLFIRGANQYQDDVGEQLTKTSNSTLWAPQVDHSAFIDQAYFAKKILNYGLSFWQSVSNWFFKRGPYFTDIDTLTSEEDADVWFQKYPQYIIDWLKQHV